ncbi:MAG: cytochrome P450 [Deltaproteobacteria bacterium]|jgi:cytochrome P450|nr:cytochrome P450 [Deltaproteobacteria bacterium]
MATEPRFPEIDFAADPLPNLHEVMAELRASEPVSRIRFAGGPIWVFNDWETVSGHIADDEILAAPPAYQKLLGPTMGRVIATMTGPQHRRNRAVVSRVFFPQRMREYADGIFAEEAHRLADELEEVERVDLVARFTRLYTFRNIARLLGLPESDITRLQDWADRIMHSFVDLESAKAAGSEMGEYLLPIVEARRAQPEDDVLSLLTQAQVNGEGLSDEEVFSFCRNLFPAAIDTSTNSLGSLIAHALEDRDLWAKLPHDPKLREDAVQELLRWEPPLVMIPRECVRAVEIAGHRIAVGDHVRLCIGGAHDDPKRYPEPRAFKPERGEPNLAFGHGEHFCLGTQMAKRVLEKGIEILSARYPDMTLCPDEPVQILGGVLRGPRSLWVAPGGAA